MARSHGGVLRRKCEVELSIRSAPISDAIGYLRVSTQEQGRSGLGLAAQRIDIERFATREGFSIESWHQDIQTGAGRDPLILRPGLATALKSARSLRCPLVVSRLDRLSRNLNFIAGLMEHKVHFMVAAFGRDCDSFTLHIYASLAEQERKMISERARAAAAVAKRRGKKFGLQLRSKSEQRRVSALGRAVLVREANERAEAYRAHIEWAFRQPGRDGGPISFRAAAHALNGRNIESPTGQCWQGHALQRMARRLGLAHPLGYLGGQAVYAGVKALWRADPLCTPPQVVARFNAAHRLGLERAGKVLKCVRQAATVGYPDYQRIGWRVDRWTATRIRIARILAKHPAYTGRQVLRSLGRKHHVRLIWVWWVMGQYHAALHRPTRTMRCKGRRFYPLWRNTTLIRKRRTVAAWRAK